MDVFSKIFTNNLYDNCDGANLQFYDCRLLVDFGQFKQGEFFSIIHVDFENSDMTFYQDDSGSGVVKFGLIAK